jgi:nicotinamide phosphoribosyltransferase
MQNIILNADSYKASHYLQYPPGTTRVSSYVESRGGRYDDLVFFGLQAFLKRYLSTPVSLADIDEAQALLTAHGLPFNRAGWERIALVHGGYLPIEISAVPEGTVVPTRNVLAQVVNTDPECFWLASYLETALLRAIWYPTTVATLARACRRIIERELELTADSRDSLPFKLHDFGARGASSLETAGLGGAAHLVSFQGTDTLAALIAARDYYDEPLAGFSIPAAEHSTIVCWGRDGEEAAYANMLAQFAGPGRMVSVVSDSYDLWNAIDELWGRRLRDAVVASGGTLVVRPDSGDPETVVLRTLEALRKRFGGFFNGRGYFQLPDQVRVIQGDGVSPTAIARILQAVRNAGFSAENLAFGMGGELLQKVDRDTCRFAMKASAVEIDGEWCDVFKDPVTDRSKRSKRGRLALERVGEGYATVRAEVLAPGRDLLEPVYRDGELLRSQTFADVRARAAA